MTLCPAVANLHWLTPSTGHSSNSGLALQALGDLILCLPLFPDLCPAVHLKPVLAQQTACHLAHVPCLLLRVPTPLQPTSRLLTYPQSLPCTLAQIPGGRLEGLSSGGGPLLVP